MGAPVCGVAVANGAGECCDDSVKAILGEERFARVTSAKLLVVGAGGIGCELLKNLVLTGFRNITVVDLDTIDVSNLNRQFLFRRAHVDRPKAEVAAEAVRQFCPAATIQAHCGNIKESTYSVEYFEGFDAIVNALDNLEARRHVNRLCLAADRPLIEAGSTGYLGQVTVIKKGETECFECEAKPTQKVFPYCTIRSTPEKPIHCLIWAKNLFDLCFGPDDESNLLSDLAEAMRSESVEASGGVDGEKRGRAMFEHLFSAEAKKAAALEELWSDTRLPPTPISFEDACKRTDVATSEDTSLLESQKLPSVSADAQGFVRAIATMYSPARRDLIGKSVFSKDDPVSMDFVHCAANLRMENYRIGRLSRWDAQSIAGAIIPAVASTNAIVAGLEVSQLIHVLTRADKAVKESRARTVWVRYPEPSRGKLLQPSRLQAPNKDCLVCGSRTAQVVLKDMKTLKINAFVKECIQKVLGANRPALYLNGSSIFDPDYPEASEEAEEEGLHPEWTLAEWGLVAGTMLQIEDEGQGFSCNMLLREDPELSEELFPLGFRFESGADSLEAAGEDAAAKRKADAEAEGERAAKRPAPESIDVE